jgi:hypothetical protein
MSKISIFNYPFGKTKFNFPSLSHCPIIGYVILFEKDKNSP